ncbi:MAG: ASKHA domain-containing protein, partial [Clostridia bacterium]
MDKIIVKCDNQILFAEKGENLLALLQRNGIAISSDCGGKKRCLKCKVKISPQVDSACKQFLDKNEYDLGVRLACFISVDQELTIQTLKNSAADILSVDKSGWTGETTKEKAKNLKKFACVDIGTTTVTISVCDENFAHIKTVNFLNPQRSFGADVISRILAADEGHLIDLQRQICDSVYSVLAAFDVSKVVVAANNVMLHLLLGVSPHSIGVSPYSPTFKEMKRLTFGEVFGQGDGEIVLLPSVSGYVGGDIVAGMIATEIEKKNNSLFVDLGTNGEIVLNANGKLFCASTAAGPAFEGGNISCGSYARKKAVAKVEMKDGKIIIDDKDADAICGSGLIDLTAVLVENYIIDEMGGFDTESELVK